MRNRSVRNIVWDIGEKLSDYEKVKEIVNNEKNYINFEGNFLNPFNELSLSHGIPALCVLYGELNEQYPEQGWDVIGHEYMKRMGEYIEEKGITSLSMFSGVSGIGLSAVCLSNNRSRYGNFISSMNSFIEENIPGFIEILRNKESLNMSDYDVIEGVCGIANYCMLFPNNEEMKQALRLIVGYIIELCKDKTINGLVLPGWYISAENQFSKVDQKLWPEGCFNIGLSHGVPGMLLVLCNSTKCGIHLEDQDDSINKLVDFLIKFHISNDKENYWGSHISLEEYREGKVNSTNSRDAWCYGTPGAAYSVLIAGKYLNNMEYIDEAVNAMKGAINRLRDIYSPTFCHGFSGIAYISNRFYEVTKQQDFKKAAIDLTDKILELYDEKAPFGFYNMEKSEEGMDYLDYIGIIDGVTGIILTLLAIENGKKTPWDCAFSLQEV
ncbi:MULTISPECIES: lanthionine synthetase C family protein [unclassified Clostridium]|uniref:Lanthionine synthetase C-like protein n=2 Tax=Clostridiaceae TaxID=31979 RepID=A0ACD6B9R6_9CLOT|nr:MULTISPECIES: lanthionine synthetase C family protein [unclassified Clostridium]EKQ50560.1 MAG: Lanthionine synthetase C-like protein [Clostridium sp. Maddingley MBC34-26]